MYFDYVIFFYEAKKQKRGNPERKAIATEDHSSTNEDEEQSLFDIVKGGKTALRVCGSLNDHTLEND